MPLEKQNQSPPANESESLHSESPVYHAKLKEHLEKGEIPQGTTLAQAAVNKLIEVGIEVNPPPHSEVEIKRTPRSVEQILDILMDDENPGFQTVFLGSKDAETLIKNSRGNVVCHYLDKFHGLDHNDIFDKLIESGDSERIAYYLDNFHGLDHNKILKLIELDVDWYFVVRALNKFKDIDHNDIANKMIDIGRISKFADYIDFFHNLDTTIANRLIEAGKYGIVARNIKKFSNLPASIAYVLCEHNLNWYVLNRIDNFIDVDQNKLLSSILSSGEIFLATQYNEKIGSPNKDLSVAYNIMNDFVTQSSYNTIKEISSGDISQENMQDLRIDKTGESGLTQLRERINRMKSDILDESFDPEILESDFYRQYMKSFVRFEESAWGDRDGESFDEIIKKYNELKQNGELKPLPDYYEPSGKVLVDKIDRESQEAFTYPEPFLNRYRTIQSSLKSSIDLFEKNKPLSHLVEQVELKRQSVLDELQQKIVENSDNPKAIGHLNQRIVKLKSLNLRNIKEFQDNFAALAQFKEFHDELRQLTFYIALHENKNYRDMAENIVSQKEPTIDDLSSMINFAGHIVNEETWNKYFTNKQAAKAFGNVIDISALEQEFSRAQNQDVKGTMQLEFIPTRGLLMEFSGHIADACWASRYESISNEFPNFSSVIMVQNRGTKHERLAGASMLVETTAQDGTPLLVIRGLNPIQNVINQLSVEDFVEKFTNYAQSIAKESGRELAIVIDDHSGGASTNRPVLFNYLDDKKNTIGGRKTLSSPGDTKFNGYDITRDTFLV